MNYSTHIHQAKIHFPELRLHLLDESEFKIFKNEDFALKCINKCVELCNNASEKLKINLNFAVNYNYAFNAKATVRKQHSLITFNIGLIEKLENIIYESIELFLYENIASLIIQESEKERLKKISTTCCIYYLFYHELAHVIQSSEAKESNTFDLQEQYSNERPFDIRQHIYEFDADLFGSSMSTYKLLEKIKNINNQFEIFDLFNFLTALLFTTGNIIIIFSGNLFQKIYYRENSHPHPIIRILKINEQIMSFASKNLAIQREFFDAILQRSATMISQLEYSEKIRVNYTELYKNNKDEIIKYIDEIEVKNENHSELIRFKTQEIFNILNY
ncbi:hypothetical protein GCM10008015_02940 [Flavobacterium palustre]|uniref:Peptidase U49 n=1 Tax=Flavobacterium palustre TaxID=1476463 RepID=A0ABQ1H8N4_9FLAO|nr:hypothetical protein [Flavobacterium palustre]GGA65583.1 hypothetical protein GCM10008015_02940 [Flavobacterium palustre]